MYATFTKLTAVLLVLATCQQANACNPQIQGVVDQLLAQLGIAPIGGVNGADGTGATGAFITAGSQLNCDLENLAVCRWSNLGNTVNPQIDTAQWYHFSKTGNVAGGFSLLQPFGREPALNSKVLLGGSQTSSPGAVWMSDPIQCMEQPGTLSAEYWIQGAARVRALVLDANTYQAIWTSPTPCTGQMVNVFNPLDPANGQCKQTIPPQTGAFRLAIQVYNLNMNFAIIDNILFDGTPSTTCTGGPLEFGTTATTMTSATTGEAITVPADLQCADPLSTSCKWSNDGNAPEWMTHTGTVDVSKWAAATGTSTVPTGEFLMVHGAAGQGPAVLRSEAIACQQGGGIVALSAWMTEGVTMKVCVEDANGVQSDCEPLLRGQGPAYVAPIKGDFQNAKIVVIAENWGQGGMAAVDDIEYIGTMCNGQSDSGLMIGGPNTEVIPYTGAPIAPIESNADLACTVDTPDACQWGDPDPTHQWFWVDNVDASKLNQLTGTSVVPTSGAAYYEFPGENEFTFLGSDEMYCLQSDGNLVFSVWSTAGVQVEVCAVMYQWVNEDGITTGKEVCKPPVSVQSPGPAAFPFTVAEIENEPFVFVITAYTATTPAFIMIDDIAFTGQICTEKPVATPPPVSNDEQSCETLSTSFNSNTAIPAGWKNCETGCPDNAQMAKWFPTSDVLGHHNIRVRGATGAIKPHLGASLHQQLDSSGKDIGHGIAVLQSLDVKFTTPRLMSFSYQRGTFGSQLYVCRNAVPSLVRRDIPLFHESCKKIAGPNMYAAEWINGGQGTFLIEPTDERLYFVFSAPWKYSYGDAHCLIDDILIHEGTTADTPPLCLPLN